MYEVNKNFFYWQEQGVIEKEELSKLCNVSQSYMSRVIRKILKKIENRLLQMQVCEKSMLKKNKRRY